MLTPAMTWSHIFIQSWQQPVKPLDFLALQIRQTGRIWWPAWVVRGGYFLAGGLVLYGLAWLNGHNGLAWSLGGLVVLLMLQMVGGFCIILSQQIQFWLLYVYSPLTITLAYAGTLLYWLSWPGFMLWLGLITFLAGKMVADIGLVWVHNRQAQEDRNLQRRREQTPATTLPALSLWPRIRWFRLGMSVYLGLAGLYLLWTRSGQALDYIALGGGIVGLLGLEATALIWAGRPLLTLSKTPHQVNGSIPRCPELTYPGQTALFVPPSAIKDLINQALSQSPAQGGQMLMALMAESNLAPILKRRFARAHLTEAETHHLLLGLSLIPGGAEAILYLKHSRLQPPLAQAADYYAHLAQEASTPLTLQRWLNLLGQARLSEPPATLAWSEAFQQALNLTEAALNLYQPDPVLIAQARTALDRFIRLAFGLEPEFDLSSVLSILPNAWPMALKQHLDTSRHARV